MLILKNIIIWLHIKILNFLFLKFLELVNNYNKNNETKNYEIEKNEIINKIEKNEIINKKNYDDIGIMYKFQSIIN